MAIGDVTSGKAIGLSLVLGMALAGATPATAAEAIDTTSGFFAAGTINAGAGDGFSFSPVNKFFSAGAGGVVKGFFGDRYGAEVVGTIGAKFNVNGSASFRNDYTSLFIGKVSTFAGNPFGPQVVGSSFALGSTIAPNKQSLYTGKGRVQAQLNETIFAGANARGRFCAITCIGGDIVSLGIGDPKQLQIIGYDSGTNSVTFLGNTTQGALPQQYAAGGFVPITARVEAPDFTAKGSGGSVVGFTTQQEVASVYVDAAGVLANAFGIPTEALYGSVFGFNYNVLSAKIGAGIDLRMDISQQVTGLLTRYTFSAPVQLFSNITNSWVDVGTSTVQQSGAFSILRAPGVTNLGILREPLIRTRLDVDTDINLALKANIRLLEVSGNGLGFGPLYAGAFSTNLAGLGGFDFTANYESRGYLAPLNLKFDPVTGAALGEGGFATLAAGGLADLGVLAAEPSEDPGSVGFVFVPAGERGGVVFGAVRQAGNFGTRGCNDDITAGCRFDDSFAAIPLQRRLVRNEDGTTGFEYGEDFAGFDSIEALPDGVFTRQSSATTLLAGLDRLPGAGGYDLPIISDGSSELFAVPEPATWAMLVIGFGLVGTRLRRRAAVRRA